MCLMLCKCIYKYNKGIISNAYYNFCEGVVICAQRSMPNMHQCVSQLSFLMHTSDDYLFMLTRNVKLFSLEIKLLDIYKTFVFAMF